LSAAFFIAKARLAGLSSARETVREKRLRDARGFGALASLSGQRIDRLASQYGISPNYLVQILIELKAKGITRSVRGKDGGYLLARAPSEISLGDVLRAVHGEVFDAPALGDANCPAELRRAWRKLKISLESTADSVTFQQLLDEGAEKEKMYYI
jgi:Rrf2 family protein